MPYHNQPQKPFSPHVQSAIEDGKLWRAKEILQGTIANSVFDPFLYEQYGIVLLEMQDLVEAGKYLFLCGQTTPEYEEAISLYLHKFGRRNWQVLVASFPRAVKQIKTEFLPEVVQRELARLNAPQDRGRPLHDLTPKRSGCADKFALLSCALTSVLILLLCCLIVATMIYGFGKIFG